MLTHSAALGASFDFAPSQRYPDPSIELLDPGFGRYRLFSGGVELLAVTLGQDGAMLMDSAGQMRLSALEQPREQRAEVAVDRLERRAQAFTALAVEVADGTAQAVDRFGQFLLLGSAGAVLDLQGKGGGMV